VNKTDLINQLAERLDGDKKAAQAAVEGFIDLVQREVQKGRNVSISGFGVFEKRLRAARTARNPRTGEAVKVKKTTVPAFRPGKYFKDVIAGTVKLPKPTGKPTSARAAAAAAKAGPTAAAKTTTTRAPRATAAAKAPTATRTRAAAKPATTGASPTRTRATAAKATSARAPRATTAKAATAAKATAAPKTTTAAAKATTTRRAPAKAK
jgi:DNA-binding protein HU-beta